MSSASANTFAPDFVRITLTGRCHFEMVGQSRNSDAIRTLQLNAKIACMRPY